MSLDISALYRRYRSELLHHLQRLVQCPDAAQDLLQESYVILSRSAAVGAIEHPRGFLYRIAGNLALDHLRHNKIVDAHRTAWATHEAEPFPDAAEQLSDQQWRALLHQTIAELPPRCEMLLSCTNYTAAATATSPSCWIFPKAPWKSTSSKAWRIAAGAWASISTALTVIAEARPAPAASSIFPAAAI
ncbi:RNA polymerase sigma factor [Methylomonas koyamae]|uniref:RNA polymerase sigma factor n=1 Tax=Methylomonas koyamae TaxID=702114 RepID=UPI0021105E01|nr:RNA polymerase sigma factor [Methylomonas koyamae]